MTVLMIQCHIWFWIVVAFSLLLGSLEVRLEWVYLCIPFPFATLAYFVCMFLWNIELANLIIWIYPVRWADRVTDTLPPLELEAPIFHRIRYPPSQLLVHQFSCAVVKPRQPVLKSPRSLHSVQVCLQQHPPDVDTVAMVTQCVHLICRCCHLTSHCVTLIHILSCGKNKSGSCYD